MSTYISTSTGPLSPKARRYDHSDERCGSYVDIDFYEQGRSSSTANLSLRSDEARALAQEMIAIADAIDATPWGKTDKGKQWAKDHGDKAEAARKGLGDAPAIAASLVCVSPSPESEAQPDLTLTEGAQGPDESQKRSCQTCKLTRSPVCIGCDRIPHPNSQHIRREDKWMGLDVDKMDAGR